MATSKRPPAKSGKSSDTDKNNYVRSEFAIGAAIICFILGFFVARVASTPNPLAQQSSGVPQQNTAIPIQNASNDADWVASLEAQAAKSPDSAVSWTRLGNAYYDTEQYLKAIDAYAKSIELNPGDANVLTDMGVMYRRVDRPEEAIKRFDRAISVDPKHGLSRYNKGIVLLHDLNDTQGAIAAWEVLAKQDPQFRSPTGQLLTDMIRGLK
jgi:tetratricopeptide (TPR) repeat protein